MEKFENFEKPKKPEPELDYSFEKDKKRHKKEPEKSRLEFESSIIKPIAESLKTIAAENGLEFSMEEARNIEAFIMTSSFYKHGEPSIPPLGSNKFSIFDLDYTTSGRAKGQKDIVRLFENYKGKLPDTIFVKADEKTNTSGRIIKIPFSKLNPLLLDYIIEMGQGTYIVTDGQLTTVTFLDNGVVYHNRIEKSDYDFINQPKIPNTPFVNSAKHDLKKEYPEDGSFSENSFLKIKKKFEK